MPAFSTAKVRDMFDDMVDIAQQMVSKWERYHIHAFMISTIPQTNSIWQFIRFGPRHVIDAVEDFTRLAFDTIALCAMSYRYVCRSECVAAYLFTHHILSAPV